MYHFHDRTNLDLALSSPKARNLVQSPINATQRCESDWEYI